MHEPVNLEMPEKGSKLKFINYHRKIKVPVVVYADFESILEPIHSCHPSQEKSYTVKTQKHVPVSFYYSIVFFDESISQPIVKKYTGENVAQKFVDMLEEDIREIHQNFFQKPVPLKITKEEEEKYKKADKCWICKKNLLMKKIIK